MEEMPNGGSSPGTHEPGGYQPPSPAGGPEEPNPYTSSSAPSGANGSGTDKEKKKSAGKGWLFGMGCVGCGLLGCLGTVVLIVVLFVGGIMWIKGNILSEKALDIPPTYISEAETTALDKKLKAFNQELSKKTGLPVPLSLTTKELNYFSQKMAEETKMKLYAETDANNKIAFKASIPMGEAAPVLYMNWSGKGEFAVKKGKFETKFDELTIGKTVIPGGDFLKGFSEGVSEELNESEALKKLAVTVETMEIKDGVINLELKSNPNADNKPIDLPEKTGGNV